MVCFLLNQKQLTDDGVAETPTDILHDIHSRLFVEIRPSLLPNTAKKSL